LTVATAMLIVILLALLTAACGASPPASISTTSSELPFGEHASFRQDKAALRAEGAPPQLLDKVSASAFRYFRLLSRQFARRACYEFRDLRWRLPSVAVHGDAHLEQFVVTGRASGLGDFDTAGFGPAVVDLVRYAASIRLACREASWPCNADQAVATYFDAYRAALDHPVARREPAIADRIRATTPQDRQAWLKWADGLMEPMPAADEDAIRRGWFHFIELMKETSPDRPESFYRISRLGVLHIGIGSALEPKTLIRIEGPTDRPEDDLILEARVTAIPAGHDCVSRPENGGSLNVLMFESLLGRRLPEVFGFFPREGAREAPELWVRSWDDGYRELALADLRDQQDVNELAVDAATQLAGHFWTTFPEPLRGHQRFGQLRAFEMSEARARSLARELADEMVVEWDRFRQ
jgi:hypothetical protein